MKKFFEECFVEVLNVEEESVIVTSNFETNGNYEDSEFNFGGTTFG